MILEHTLKNTGKTALETDVFNHNFFMLDAQPTGPDIVVKFPFEAKSGSDWRGPGEVTGKELVYKQELPEKVSVSGAITGFGDTAKDQDFRVENRKTGLGVRQSGTNRFRGCTSGRSAPRSAPSRTSMSASNPASRTAGRRPSSSIESDLPGGDPERGRHDHAGPA